VESTHRHDKVMVEMQKEGRGLKRQREPESMKKGEMDYFEVAVNVAEGFCSLEDLDSDIRERVLKMQKMAEAGKQKQKEGEEKEKGKGKEMEVDVGEYANNETACEGGGGLQDDFREMVKRLAQERLLQGEGIRV
jgi:hypothetical protein